jgi:protein SCO1/2
MKNTGLGLFLLVVFIGGIYAALVIAPPSSKDEPLSEQTQYLSWYPQARALADFTLTKHTNVPFTNEDLMGKWTLAFVGYTFCPDICPVTLSEISEIYPEITAIEAKHPLQVWFLSVDPKRDSVERLNEYINYFNADFVGSTGPHEQIFPLVRSMGMMYSLSESTDNENYLVDHSASIVVINPKGNVVGRFKPKQQAGKLAISDMQQIKQDLPIILASD